ncbi:MAG: hypothetical protein QOF73_5200 [Thermomicrobiales bacterium]|nr:hypothetical protein [Thermomicrobiales bacterium]
MNTASTKDQRSSGVPAGRRSRRAAPQLESQPIGEPATNPSTISQTSETTGAVDSDATSITGVDDPGLLADRRPARLRAQLISRANVTAPSNAVRAFANPGRHKQRRNASMKAKLATTLILLILASMPVSALADTTSATATLTLVIPYRPPAAEVLPGCQFVVTAGGHKAYCTVTLIAADPTLRNKGWRVTLAVAGFSCTCNGTLPPNSLTIDSATAPTLINGQPVDSKGGPKLQANSVGQNTNSSRAQLVAKPGYGNGAYSVTMVLRLSYPYKTVPGTYIPTWLLSVVPDQD